MTFDTIYQLCHSFAGVTEEFPFDEDTLVFKVAGKMFALTSVTDLPMRINLKCDPDRAVLLRAEHASILPGYHMNKKHWNTVVLDGSLADQLVVDLVAHSWERVVAGLPAKVRLTLQ